MYKTQTEFDLTLSNVQHVSYGFTRYINVKTLILWRLDCQS